MEEFEKEINAIGDTVMREKAFDELAYFCTNALAYAPELMVDVVYFKAALQVLGLFDEFEEGVKRLIERSFGSDKA